MSEERRINQKHVNILKAELKESRRKLYEMENRLKTDLTPKEELSKLIKNILRCQQFGELSTASENADNIFKVYYIIKLNILLLVIFCRLFSPLSTICCELSVLLKVHIH